MMTPLARLNEKRRILKELTDLDYRKAELSFSHFSKAAWSVLEPDTVLKWNWHHDAVCEYLTALRNGDITRLLINMPPRYMKSILCSVFFPAWCWTTDPGKRFMYGSYSASLSTKHSIDCRSIIESSWYQTRWADRFALSDDQNVKTEFTNTKRGHRIATSMTGTAIGKGGDYVGIDDPHDTTRVEGDATREETINNFRQKFTSRLDDKKTGRIFVVMQRLHARDLSGIIESGELGHYEILKLEGVAEERKIISLPISKREIVREAGDLLHTDREGPAEIAIMRKALGSYGFSGQYQQRPTPPGGAIIKRAWMQRRYKELPDRFDEVILSADLTFKDTDKSDYVAFQVWGRRDANKYLLDRVKARMDIVESIRTMLTLSQKWPRAVRKLVEDKANGPAVISILQDRLPGLIAVEPKGSKEARAHAVAPEWEAGNIWLPEHMDGLDEFIEEVITFPKGANDDEVDAMTQALIYFQSDAAGSFANLMTHSAVKTLAGAGIVARDSW